MRPLRRSIGLAVLATVSFLAALPLHADAATPTAIVSMGDSYISGEGGRWMGNSQTFVGSRSGTDRAYLGHNRYNPRQVYGTSYDNGCDRSDVAEILSNTINVDQKFNIACSGARTEHLLRSVSGGQVYKGEAPQTDQLADIARTHDIKMIVVSIGGNDLELVRMLAECGVGYVAHIPGKSTSCAGKAQDTLHAQLPIVAYKIGKVIDDIRTVMRHSGQQLNSYRLIVQSYPSVIPRGTENRYSDSSQKRLLVGGCPFGDADSTWIRDLVFPQVAEAIRKVAVAKGADFLDLQDLLQGREVCSKDAELVDRAHPAHPARSEWGRFLTSGTVQGHREESLHLNAYGQQAAGRCLELAYAYNPGHYACHNHPGKGPDSVYLTRR